MDENRQSVPHPAHHEDTHPVRSGSNHVNTSPSRSFNVQVSPSSAAFTRGYMNEQELEIQVQMQARLIEKLQSQGLLGLLQRRRVRKIDLPRYIREDELRALNVRLKQKVRDLNEELAGRRGSVADTRQ